MADDSALAERFWRLAGGPTDVPRDVASAASWALPVLVVELPGLTIAGVGEWLRARGVPVPGLPDRPLRACLVARAGGGVILLDALDPPDERRYSAAHEVAHLLRDHLLVRERAGRALGESATEVLDGLRPASVGERLDALFADVTLRPLAHLLDRDEGGDYRSNQTAEAEAAADRLALELLAPQREAARRLAGFSARHSIGRAGDLLARDFGLPGRVARAYAERLLRHRDADRPLREWLGLTGPPKKS